MSTEPTLSQPHQIVLGLFLSLGPLLSLAIAYRARVFSPRSLLSPDRIGPDEQTRDFILILAAGLLAWVLAPAFYGAFLGPREGGDRPAGLTQEELVVASALASTGAMAVLLLGNALYRPQGLRRLGLGLQRLGVGVRQGVMGIIVVLPLMTWVGILTMWLWQSFGLEHPQKHDLLEILDKTPDPKLGGLIIFTAVVIAPLSEELLFRGHIQSLLRHLIGSPWVAIVLSSIAFTIVHIWWTQPPIFFLSLCLGYVYERSGNLWSAIILHALFNGISIIASQWV